MAAKKNTTKLAKKKAAAAKPAKLVKAKQPAPLKKSAPKARTPDAKKAVTKKPIAQKAVAKTTKTSAKAAPVKASKALAKPVASKKPAKATKPVKVAKATKAAKAVKPAKNKHKQATKPTKVAKPTKAPTSVKAEKSTKEPKAVTVEKKLSKAVVAPVVIEKPESKAVLAEKKPQPVVKNKSSVVDFLPPVAPIKPKFVPPKSPVVDLSAAAKGSNGSHSPSFIQKQKQRLLDLRDELLDAVSGMARDTIRKAPEGSEASGSGQHQGDAGSDAYDRDFALSVLAKEQDALYEIEQALIRIRNGTYGTCEISSKKIPQMRLEAIPFARLTVECQAQWEKEYGNRRFRPSNEVGFSGGIYSEDEDSETVSLDEDED